MSLFPLWAADLRKPWWPFMPATDASPSFGYGLSVANCSPELSRQVGQAAADPSCVIRLTVMPGDPDEIARSGSELRLPLCIDDFKTVFSIESLVTSHSGAMEAEGVKFGLLRLTRQARWHAHRGAILVDAQAVGFALRKGRRGALQELQNRQSWELPRSPWPQMSN